MCHRLANGEKKSDNQGRLSKADVWNVFHLGSGVSLLAVVNGTNALQTTIRPAMAQVNLEFGPVTLLSNGTVQMGVNCLPGQTCIIQASTNLVNWMDIATNYSIVGSFQFTDLITTNYSCRVYRVVEQ
jgi:hypothetical protein